MSERSSLILSRRLGRQETIVIDPGGLNVEVEVIELTAPNRVKVHVRAPQHVKILRNELLDKPRPTRPTASDSRFRRELAAARGREGLL